MLSENRSTRWSTAESNAPLRLGLDKLGLEGKKFISGWRSVLCPQRGPISDRRIVRLIVNLGKNSVKPGLFRTLFTSPKWLRLVEPLQTGVKLWQHLLRQRLRTIMNVFGAKRN